MSRRVKLKLPLPNGEMAEKEGTIIEVNSATEPWSEYILEDGSKLRVKQVITQVVRLDEDAPDGTPAYNIQAQPLMSLIPAKDDLS